MAHNHSCLFGKSFHQPASLWHAVKGTCNFQTLQFYSDLQGLLACICLLSYITMQGGLYWNKKKLVETRIVLLPFFRLWYKCYTLYFVHNLNTSATLPDELLPCGTTFVYCVLRTCHGIPYRTCLILFALALCIARFPRYVLTWR